MEEIKKEKKIETLEMEVGKIKTEFGNPRKIRKEKMAELEKSLEDYGDFGIFLIDEKDNVIAGNMRLQILRAKDPTIKVLCKRLVGYTVSELRAINIRDNTHSGEWDLDLLADWTADLNIDLGLENESLEDKKIEEMELIRYEKYNYVMIVCKNELDYNELVRKLEIEGKIVRMSDKKKIKARAVWYDKISGNIRSKL
jgi:hypothetical protein